MMIFQWLTLPYDIKTDRSFLTHLSPISIKKNVNHKTFKDFFPVFFTQYNILLFCLFKIVLTKNRLYPAFFSEVLKDLPSIEELISYRLF